MPGGRDHADAPHQRESQDDASDVARASGLILPGGKVSAEALAKAAQQAGDAADEDEELGRVVFSLQRDLKKRLDKYLTDRIGFMSRNQLQRLIDEGGVLVNDKLPKASTVLRAGDVVEVVVPPPPSKDILAEDIPLDVMYEDEYIIVLNKQPDIIVHPARTHLKGTMINALTYHFQNRSPFKGHAGNKLSTVGGEFARPGVVHRLDRHTSGCIVFAKQDEAHWKLGHQFEHRTVDKRYLAVVEGRIEPDQDVINLPIGNHPSKEKGYREKYVVRHDEQGKNAVTIYRVRERYRLGRHEGVEKGKADQLAGAAPRPAQGWNASASSVPHPSVPSCLRASVPSTSEYSLVELELKTGRTHQIRVHLSHNEWPIVGDDMYAGRPFVDDRGETIIARQALHACTLGFKHPITEQPMQFTAPLRGDIARLVQTLRRMSGGGERVETKGATVDLEKAVGAPA